ncbi:MAG: YbaK/EbsC family protein [Candidatus Bathyarchaeia archaeon]
MDLEEYLRAHKVEYRIIDKTETVHTADAAAATGIPLEKITKSLIFVADGRPVAVVIPGTCKVNTQKLRSVLKAENVRLVPFEEAEQYSGYPPGGTPPLHYKNVSKIVIDKKVADQDLIYGGGGSRNKLLELKTIDLLRLNGGLVADVAESRTK